VDAELLETGTQGQKHAGIVADHRVRGAPLRNGLAAAENNPQTSGSAHRLCEPPITTDFLPPAIRWAYPMVWRHAVRQGYGRLRRISS
jgi:hypothetical protein